MNVSVVIPLYNKARYIERAINSVLRQTLGDFECIVVDDGSTDSSGEIVAGIKDPRIRLVRQLNGGVSLARNQGIAQARSGYVAFLDADDEWMPDFLSQSLCLHQQHPEIVASFANYHRTGASGATFREDGRGPRVLTDYFAFCLTNAGLGMWSSVVMARRDAILKAGGFPVGRKMGEDLDTWARLAWTGRIGYLPAVLANYHFGDGVCALSERDAGQQKWESLSDIHETYLEWKRAGLVSDSLIASTAALVCFFRQLDIHAAIRRKQLDQARLLYAGMPWEQCLSPMSLCGYIALKLPIGQRIILGLGRRLDERMLALRWNNYN